MNVNEALSELIKAAVADAIDPSIKKAVAEALQENTKKQEQVIPYFNLNGAAQYLNVTRQSLTTYMKNGVVKSYRLNGSPRFKKSDLDATMIPIEVKLYKSQSK